MPTAPPAPPRDPGAGPAEAGEVAAGGGATMGAGAMTAGASAARADGAGPAGGFVVVGAGVAGLAAAGELFARGAAVTLVDRLPVAGGVLRDDDPLVVRLMAGLGDVT